MVRRGILKDVSSSRIRQCSSAKAASILRRLSEPHRIALRSCLGLARKGLFSLAIHGSVAADWPDRFSDIDVTLAHDASLSREFLHSKLRSLIARIGEPLVEFDAGHVGAPDVRIMYLRCSGWVVKLDIRFVIARAGLILPATSLVLYDPEGRFHSASIAPPPAIAVSLLLTKLTGWLWFGYGRIARGEYFAAARSIDFSREHGLLPLILQRHGLPQDGHRHLEQRLRLPDILALKRTYPRALDHGSLMEALSNLHELIELELRRSRFAGKKGLHQSLDSIWSCIQSSERKRTVRAPFT